MVFAENAEVDAVYWPTAVMRVAKVMPFNSVCSWVMNALYELKLSTVEELMWPMENTSVEFVVLGVIMGSEDKPTRLTISDPIWI